MPKSKRAPIKRRFASKGRSKAAARKSTAPHNRTRELSKRDTSARHVARSNLGPCSFASIKASATPSRVSRMASSGRGPPIPASPRSHAPSPARPGVGHASLPCNEPAAIANQPPGTIMAGISAG